MSEERTLILKLGQMITDRIGHKVTVDDPEYWGLAEVLTDEMAEVCLAMKVRKPMTLEQIAKKSGKDKARVQQLLDEMSVIGMIEYNWENADRHKQYVLPMFVPGCAEFMMMNKKQTEEHPVIAEFFENMSRLPLEKVTPMVPPGGSGIGMHVIPVEKAIPAQQQSASVEHISHWLRKYQDKYAVGACSCRRQQRMRGEGCGEIEGDLCIGVGDMADYLVETGKGRYIDLDEVMEILERAERNGFVHQITNIDGEEKIFAICNCAPGVCNGLRTSQLFNTPNCIPGPRGKREMRGLRKVRGSLSGGRGQTGPEAVHEARRDRVPESASSGCGEVGARQMGSGLPGPCEDQLLRDRHITVQDRVPGAPGGAGLHKNGGGGALPGCTEADQTGQSIPGRVRRDLQPALRGCLHERHGGSGRCH